MIAKFFDSAGKEIIYEMAYLDKHGSLKISEDCPFCLSKPQTPGIPNPQCHLCELEAERATLRATLERTTIAAAQVADRNVELRAECERLTELWTKHALDGLSQCKRADAAEAVAKRERITLVAVNQRASDLAKSLDEAEAELASAKSELDAIKRGHGELGRYERLRLKNAELIAELAKERARLDWLSTQGFEHRHHETGDHLAYEWTISSANELKDVSLREVIDAAMKESQP